MTIDEAGDNQSSLKIDDAGFWTDEVGDLLLAADRDDDLATCGQCCRLRMIGIDGDHLAAGENQIGRLLAS